MRVSYFETHTERKRQGDEYQEHGEGGEQPPAQPQASVLLLSEHGRLPPWRSGTTRGGEWGLAVGLGTALSINENTYKLTFIFYSFYY